MEKNNQTSPISRVRLKKYISFLLETMKQWHSFAQTSESELEQDDHYSCIVDLYENNLQIYRKNGFLEEIYSKESNAQMYNFLDILDEIIAERKV